MSLIWDRQDAKEIRPLPSIVQLIDYREPDYAQVAEMGIPLAASGSRFGDWIRRVMRRKYGK